MALIKKPAKAALQTVSDAAVAAFEAKAPDARPQGRAPALEGAGRKRGAQSQFTLQMKSDLMDRLNEYVKTNEAGLSRNKVIALAVKSWLDQADGK